VYAENVAGHRPLHDKPSFFSLRLLTLSVSSTTFARDLGALLGLPQRCNFGLLFTLIYAGWRHAQLSLRRAVPD
jgi:hypothetical protein